MSKGGKRPGAGRPKGEESRVLYKRVPAKHYEEIKEALEKIVKELSSNY